MLGGARGTDDPLLHHPKYDFNDEILPVGASWWATLVEQQLAKDRNASILGAVAATMGFLPR